MKKRDILLAGSMIIFSLLLLLTMQCGGEKEGNQVQITVDTEVYGVYALSKDQRIEVTQGEFHNVIRIEDGQAYMEDADCPDGYCMEQGNIQGQKETIVCLPHKLVVEVIRGQEEEIHHEENSDLVPDTIAK